MTTCNGAQTVAGGFYWNRREWKIEVVNGRTGVLPGDETTVYTRVPMPAMLALAPLMGALFVVFLPFIGFALLGELAWVRGREWVAARHARGTAVARARR